MGAVLDSLLEGFDASVHPRGFHGRFRKGDKVHVVTPQGHVLNGTVHAPAQSHDVITSRGTERSRTMEVHWADGDVTHERPEDVKPGHRAVPTPNAQRSDEMASGPLQRPTERDMQRGRAAAAGAAGVISSLTAEGWKRDATGRLVPPQPSSGLGREGRAARERGASSLTTEHADTRDKLTNLPVGQRYGLHGPQGQVGHVERTAAGWNVVGPSGPVTSHKTPSSAAGAAIRIQRTAASSREQANVMGRNYRAAREVEAMNARQAKRAAKLGESEPWPGVLGALLGG